MAHLPTPTEASEDEALARLLAEGGRSPVDAERYGSAEDMVLERYGSAGAPALVLVHGGYFRPGVDRTHSRPQARALADEGWQVILPEYRRVPGAPCAATEDLAALDGHLQASGVDVQAWVGHSAGGTLALWRALTPDLPPMRAVGLAAVSDFDDAVAQRLGDDAVLDWIGRGPRDAPRLYSRLDPTRLLEGNPDAVGRIRLVHGRDDETVPVGQSETFPAETTLVTGAHHFDLIDPASRHWPAVVAVIRG